MGRFCDRLKILREKRGMSQQHLADELGISRSAVGNYELGSREPDFETLELIADYFNVDMDYLIGKSAIERRLPVLDWDNKNPMPLPVLQKLNSREQRLLSYFHMLSDGMQDRILDLIEATAKDAPKRP